MNGYKWPKVTETNQNNFDRIKDIVSKVDAKAITEKSQVTAKANTRINYEKELNERQFFAAVTTEGPVLVIAGAGSGKTRTATFRVAYLIETGISPEEILMLSFTRKAADEMTERIAKLLTPNEAKKVTSTTFHSFSIRTLKEYPQYSGVLPKHIVLDSSDAEDIVDYIIDNEDLTKDEEAVLDASKIYEVISKAKNWGVNVGECIDKHYINFIPHKEKIASIAEKYKENKRTHSKLDYDDLLIIMKNLLLKNESFRELLQNRFKYIMVDEYQDTNVIQKSILDSLASKNRNIMVVGDDWQGIYKFRGATMENILTFQESYPECKVIKLEHNYRSIQPILDFTNPVMEKALMGYHKKLFSTRRGDAKPEVHVFLDKEAEAEYVANQIQFSIQHGTPANEIAVIFRSAYISKVLQGHLLMRQIPFVVYGGMKFSERKHVKDLICALRLVNNIEDTISWQRILKLLPHIGQKSAITIAQNVIGKKQFDFTDFKDKVFYPKLDSLSVALKIAENENLTISGKVGALATFYKNNILEDEEYYKENDLDLLVNISKRYKKIDGFLNDFSIDPPNKQKNDKQTPEDNETIIEQNVTLTTVHSAKGLEWGTVYVLHGIDGIFPFHKALNNIEDIEEERRLFYVACTRAKNSLIITRPASYWSRESGTFELDSRFIADVPKSLYDKTTHVSENSPQPQQTYKRQW